MSSESKYPDEFSNLGLKSLISTNNLNIKLESPVYKINTLNSGTSNGIVLSSESIIKAGDRIICRSNTPRGNLTNSGIYYVLSSNNNGKNINITISDTNPNQRNFTSTLS